MSASPPPRPLLWDSASAAAATGGQAQGAPWQAHGVSIDSRTLEPGDLFVALVGPSHDGHDHVAAALKAGAAAALVHRRPEGVEPQAPLLQVDDTFHALEALGRAGRARTQARVVAVTGSVGKTGTKEALAHVLKEQGPTFATSGNLNNHWGVPLTLARLPAETAYAVIELGMNHAGEIGPLARQVEPDVALITTVEPAHLEFFPSVEAIADAKAEIFQGLKPGGTAVINRDNPHYARLAAAARVQGVSRIVSFGSPEDADARLIDGTIHATCSAVTALIGGEPVPYCIALPGRHWIANSLAVLLAVRALGADVARAAQALGHLPAVKGRGTRRQVTLADGPCTVIDESYNASPAAMAAACDVLSRLDPGAGGRRLVALGDMLELGPQAPALHAGLAPALASAGVDLVFCCGPHMKHLFDRLPPERRGAHAATSAELAPAVAAAARAGDLILVKGSAGSRMGTVVAALAALDREPATHGGTPVLQHQPLSISGGAAAAPLAPAS